MLNQFLRQAHQRAQELTVLVQSPQVNALRPVTVDMADLKRALTEIRTNVANKVDTIAPTDQALASADLALKTAKAAVGLADHVQQELAVDSVDLVRRELAVDSADRAQDQGQAGQLSELRQTQRRWAKKCRAAATKKKNTKFVVGACKTKKRTEKHVLRVHVTARATSSSTKKFTMALRMSRVHRAKLSVRFERSFCRIDVAVPLHHVNVMTNELSKRTQ